MLHNFVTPKRPECGKDRYFIEKRRDLLNLQIEISKGHDGWFYHFETFPVIERVNFNNSLVWIGY